MATRQYIGARYVPKFYTNSVDGTTQWEANVVYDPLIYVTLTNGHMYISKKQVPATVGTPASNANYWLDMGSYNGFIDQLQDEIDVLTENVEYMDIYVTPQMFGAKADDTTDDTQAINDAIAECVTSGKPLLFPVGTYKTSSTITFNSPQFDVIMIGVIHYMGNGNGIVFNKTYKRTLKLKIKHDLPVSSGSGIKCVGFYNNNLTVDTVEGFSYGLDLYSSAEDEWIAYNTINLGYLWDNAVGVRLGAFAPAGWVNENVFIGGRIATGVNSGLRSTCKGVVITSDSTRQYYNNNNLFVKTCAELHNISLHIEYGSYNRFISFRAENSTTAVKIENRSIYNIIEGHEIDVISDDTATKTNTINDCPAYYRIKPKKVFESGDPWFYSFESTTQHECSLPPYVLTYTDGSLHSYSDYGHRGAGYVTHGTLQAFVVRVDCTNLVGKKIGAKGYAGAAFRYAVKFFDSNNIELTPADVGGNMSLGRATIDGTSMFISGADRTNETPMQQLIVPDNCAYMYIGIATTSFKKFELYVFDTDTFIDVVRVTNYGLASAPTETTNCRAGDFCNCIAANATLGWKYDGSTWQAIT